MMDNTNQLTLIGRIVSDPKLRIFDSGNQRVEFRICFDRRKRNDAGTYETTYEAYYDVEAWSNLAAKVAQLPKGVKVAVIGQLWEDTWNDRETGAKRSKPLLKADMVLVDLFPIREIESRRGFLALSWGRPERAEVADLGAEVGKNWDQEPF